MQRHRCRTCLARAPLGARGKDACPHCGGALVHEARCAWCLSWTSSTVCETCTAELLPPPDFGAARMLVSGGVDRFSLPERVRALSRNQFTALSSRFDAEWGALTPRLEELRWVTSMLLAEGHADTVEPYLIGLVPLDKDALAELSVPAILDLAALSERSAVAPLAAIARVHTHQADASAHRQVAAMAAYDTTVRGAEAALAVVRAVVIDGVDPGFSREACARLAATLELVAERPRCAEWVVIGRAWLAGYGRAQAKPDPVIDAALHDAIACDDRDARLAAAILSAHEGALAKLLTDAEPYRVARARRALAELGSDRIAAELAGGDTATQRQILRSLRHPLSRLQLGALLGVIARDEAIRDDGLRFLMSPRYAELSAEARGQVAAFVAAGAAGLDVDALLRAMTWATTPTDAGSDAPPVVDDDRRPLVDAVTARLAGCDTAARTRLLRERRGDVERWLRVAPADDVAPIVDAWARGEPADVEGILDACIVLHGRLNGYGQVPDDRGWRHVSGVLDRGGEAEAARIAAALSRHRGVSGREAIVDGLWARFKQQPERRRWIMQAGRVYRQELTERRRALEADGALSLREPATFFAIMADADPDDAPALMSEAIEAVAADDHAPLVALVDALVVYAEPRLAYTPCTTTRAIANLAAPIANRYRAQPEQPALLAAARAIGAAWARLAPLCAAPQPVSEGEARFAHVVEHIELELRLIREREAQLAEARAEAARREAARAARDAERQRAEQERQRAEEERQRAEAEAERLRAHLATLIPPPPSAADALAITPDIPAEGLDAEPLLAGTPLPALIDYVRVLKAMGTCGDIMAMFTAAGLTPQSWAVVAGAWTQVLTTRPQVALRFSALLSASWSPRRG